MENASKAKTRIHHLARALNWICRIARVIFIVLAVVGMIGAVVSILLPDTMDRYKGFFEQNTIFRILQYAADLGSMEPRYVFAIGCTVTSITFATLSFYTRYFQNLLSRMIETERPFTRETAQEVRRGSYFILLTVLYNPIVGVVIFLVTMLFSYLVDYGAYLQEKADQTNRIQGEMIVSFAEITENKSGQTGQHIRRVAEYTRVLARTLGMNEERANALSLASTMHDIGKLMIPSEILEKPGKLTEEEYAIIKTHTTYGGKLLENVEGEEMALARTIALEHHERPDGRGYPKGLTDISLEGRIVAVADVYDALTSKRSYKDAWEQDRARQEIVKGSGAQFDEGVVRAFESAYGEIERIREKYQD